MKKITLSLVLLACLIKLFGQPPSNSLYQQLIYETSFNGTDADYEDIWWKSDCSNSPKVTYDFTHENVTYGNNDGLRLTARNQNNQPYECSVPHTPKLVTSGEIKSSTYYKYGYYEIEAKLPAGQGFWPAFWFFNHYNNINYQEIDVLEACGSDCTSYTATSHYENDNNGVVDDNRFYKSNTMDNNSLNLCNTFHRYGVEWTPDFIKYYFDGNQIGTTNPNHNIDLPMAVIIGFGMNNCGESTNTADLPASFVIKSFKAYQKPKDAVYLLGSKFLCENETIEIRAPYYPYATYSWSSSNQDISVITKWPNSTLEHSGRFLLFEVESGGALQAGATATITLTVTFPNGYVEEDEFDIEIIDSGLPDPPSSIEISPSVTYIQNEGSIDEKEICCHSISTTLGDETTISYNWVIEYPVSSGTPPLDPFIFKTLTPSTQCIELPNGSTIKVSIKNSCGESSPYVEVFNSADLIPVLSIERVCDVHTIVPNCISTQTFSSEYTEVESNRHCFMEGNNCYDINIRNTDCTSHYTIHIKRPNGTWVAHDWGYRTNWFFCPETTGIYTFYLRQDTSFPVSSSTFVYQTGTTQYVGSLECCRFFPTCPEGNMPLASVSPNIDNESNVVSERLVEPRYTGAIPSFDDNIIIYPNPADNKLIIEYVNQSSISSEILIYDILGNIINANIKGSLDHENRVILDISKLPQGVYFLIISDGRDFYSKKIIVSR